MKLLDFSDSDRLDNINWDKPADEQPFSRLSNTE